MSFFDHHAEHPDRSHQPQQLRPGWSGPPSDELPGVVPVGTFLHRGPRLAMALKMLEVYSTGCVVDLVWAVRRGDESDEEWRVTAELSLNQPQSSLEDMTGLQVGVALTDGTQAVADQHGHSSGEADGTGPVLTVLGGGGGSSNHHLARSGERYWFWPLPVEGESRLVVRWDALGLPESSLTVSGEDLRTALGRVGNYWPEEMST